MRWGDEERDDDDLDNPETYEERIAQMERKLDRLRALYESFFMGAERSPPNIPRRELNRLILELQQVQIPQSGLRYRFQAVVQRWVLHTSYWNRILREIEAGTYRRDLERAQRHLAKKGGELTEQEALALGIPTSRVKAFIERQNRMVRARSRRAGTAPPVSAPAAVRAETAGPESAAASSQAPAATGVPAPSLSASTAAPPAAVSATAGASDAAATMGGITDSDIEAAYRHYAEERAKLGDKRPMPSLEKVSGRLREQIAVIVGQHQVRRVGLEVDVADGKVRFRARPIKD